MIDNPSESSGIAESVSDSDLYFIPGFGGLQAPINDPSATAGFIGLTAKTNKEQMLKAVLESIAFGMRQLLEIMETESPHSQKSDTIM
jgi:glycerol kinase